MVGSLRFFNKSKMFSFLLNIIHYFSFLQVFNFKKEKNKIRLENKKNNESSENSTRSFKYDNIKGIAIILIVFMHLSTPFFGIPVLLSIGKFIIPIAMSLFCFVSGYFSKVEENTQIKAVKNLFIPYILFCALWIIFWVFALDYPFPKNPFLVPGQGLWYLLVLFYFRFSLPALVKIKHIFLISIIGALAIGLIDVQSNFLALTRAFCYLPIFLSGYYFRNSEIYLNKLNVNIKNTILKTRDFILNHKEIALVLLIASLALLFFISNDFPKGFFGFKSSYVELGLGRKIGVLMRLFGFLTVMAGVILTVYLMPNKHTFLTKIGINSLFVYVLQFYVSEPLQKIVKTDSGSFLLNDPIVSIIFVIK